MTSTTKDLAKNYQKTQIDILKMHQIHTLGALKQMITNWTMKEDKMVHKEFSFIPGLYKCFDEGIVNCRDHYITLWQS